ncbi:MAG: T9SS type A sorting domain-containing protein [Bacteroidales bacterium]
MKKLLTIIFALSFSAAMAQDIAMQVVASSGGYFESTEAGVSMSWTLGEVAYTTLSSSEYIITQGFQQGDLFSTDVEKPDLPKSDIKVYPNPASVDVFIEISSSTAKGNATAELFDITGRMVDSKVINLEDNTPCKLTVSSLKSGIYLVKITFDNSKSSKVFKLIKE